MYQHLPFALGERLDQQHRRLPHRVHERRELVRAQRAGQQQPVAGDQFGVAPEHRPEPAALQRERQPDLLTFGQPERGGQ